MRFNLLLTRAVLKFAMKPLSIQITPFHSAPSCTSPSDFQVTVPKLVSNFKSIHTMMAQPRGFSTPAPCSVPMDWCSLCHFNAAIIQSSYSMAAEFLLKTLLIASTPILTTRPTLTTRLKHRLIQRLRRSQPRPLRRLQSQAPRMAHQLQLLQSLRRQSPQRQTPPSLQPVLPSSQMILSCLKAAHRVQLIFALPLIHLALCAPQVALQHCVLAVAASHWVQILPQVPRTLAVKTLCTNVIMREALLTLLGRSQWMAT
mmetsp:Transcript_10533/g.29084  ORF Transcript_10533/g.29084 Transcript_10533/m.29084 type:complete len:258 (-) Transcript_10533:1160-1933(-)